MRPAAKATARIRLDHDEGPDDEAILETSANSGTSLRSPGQRGGLIPAWRSRQRAAVPRHPSEEPERRAGVDDRRPDATSAGTRRWASSLGWRSLLIGLGSASRRPNLRLAREGERVQTPSITVTTSLVTGSFTLAAALVGFLSARHLHSRTSKANARDQLRASLNEGLAFDVMRSFGNTRSHGDSRFVGGPPYRLRRPVAER